MFDENDVTREISRITEAIEEMNRREGDAQLIDNELYYTLSGRYTKQVPAYAEHSIYDEYNGVVLSCEDKPSFTNLFNWQRFQAGSTIGVDYVRYWTKKPTPSQMIDTPWKTAHGLPLYPDGL